MDKDMLDLNSQGTFRNFDFSEQTGIHTVPVPAVSPVLIRSDSMYASESISSQKQKRSSEELSNFSASTLRTVPVSKSSPIEVNDSSTDNSFSSTSSKRKMIDLTEEISDFLKKRKNSMKMKSEKDYVDMFFESIAKSAIAFNLTPVEMCKLMMGTTELFYKIMDDRDKTGE